MFSVKVERQSETEIYRDRQIERETDTEIETERLRQNRVGDRQS